MHKAQRSLGYKPGFLISLKIAFILILLLTAARINAQQVTRDTIPKPKTDTIPRPQIKTDSIPKQKIENDSLAKPKENLDQLIKQKSGNEVIKSATDSTKKKDSLSKPASGAESLNIPDSTALKNIPGNVNTPLF